MHHFQNSVRFPLGSCSLVPLVATVLLFVYFWDLQLSYLFRTFVGFCFGPVSVIAACLSHICLMCLCIISAFAAWLAPAWTLRATRDWSSALGGLDMPAHADSLCQSCDGLCFWPPPESAPTPSASLGVGRRSRRSSAASPCGRGPPSRWTSSVGRLRHEHL